MSEVEIRRLGAEDVPLFKALRLESLKLAPQAFANRYEDWAELAESEWLNRLKTPVFALLSGGEPCGLMGLLPEKSSKKSHRATLIMVYLRETLRGKGLADDFLGAVLAEAKAAGHWQIELNVVEDNHRAVDFYKRHGFVPYGRIPAAYFQEGQPKAELLMLLQMPHAQSANFASLSE